MSLAARNIDGIKCPKCLNMVHDNEDCVCCDSCDKWFHRICSKLDMQNFRFLVRNPNQTWLCTFCLRNALPFQSLTDNKFKDYLATIQNNASLVNLLSLLDNMGRRCSVCEKKVSVVKKAVPCIDCIDCNSFIHQRCSGLKFWQFSKTSKIIKQWCCKTCYQQRFPFSHLDSDKLIELSYNSNYSCRCQSTNTESPDYRLLDRLNLCKLDLKEHDSLFNNDIDTFANFHSNFDYYTSHDFHKLTNNPNSDGSLSLFHTNIQSLSANNENLQILLYNLNFNFDIIALSETWHNKGNTDQLLALSLQGYQSFQGVAGNSKNGGCGFYIKDNIEFEIRKDLNKTIKSDNSEFETFWIQSGNSVFGVIYNHPRKLPSDFLNYLDSTLKKLSKENKEITLLGDFNLDLIKFDKINVVEQFINLMFSNYYQPVILQPTRYIDNSRPSLIDNIFVNSLGLKAVSGNLINKISDHMPNFLILEKTIPKNNKLSVIKRNFKNFNENDFITDVKQLNFDNLNNTQNPQNNIDIKYDYFHNNILQIIEKHAPLQPLSKKKKKQLLKPWITKGILKSITVKNKLYKKFLKSKDSFWYQRYKYYRNMLHRLIKNSKRLHYNSYFESFKTNSKMIWKGINDLINKSSTSRKTEATSIKVNGNIIKDPKQVANKFTDYFTNVAKSLVDKLGTSNSNFKDYLKDPIAESIMLFPVTEVEVLDQINSLDSSKAAGAYDIPISLIKLLKNEIKKPLMTLTNLSFTSGSFPKSIKYAKVIPIFKANSKFEVCNYRPISILPIFNKIFEKLMYSRVSDFITKHNILFPHQFGFQKHKSTSMAILDVCSKLVDAIENRKFSCCILLDFAKAFDTVNHEILLRKLDYYGIRGVALDWFRTYLKDRTQRVFLDGELSEYNYNYHGVPQGSVLGPLLFLLYINDIPQSSKAMSFHLFADDTSLFYSCENLNDLEEIVNQELAKISDWLIANKLTLNTNKSNFMIMKPRQKKLSKNVKICINNDSLRESDCVKYLGVLIDNNLTWSNHVKHVTIKVSKGIGILSKIRHYAPKNVLMNIYNAFVSPHINYAITNWGGTYPTILDELTKCLKKAARITNFKKQFEHSKPSFKALNTLNLEDTYKLECAKFFFEISKGQNTALFSSFFQKTKDQHHYGTRQARSGKLYIPTVRTNYKKHFISYSGIKIWNSIPEDIRNSPSKKLFVKIYKRMLLQEY